MPAARYRVGSLSDERAKLHSLTHSLTAALDQLRVVASSTSNDPGRRSRQHQQIGQRLLPLAAANFSVDDPAGASSQQTAVDLKLYKIFKITGVSFFGTQCQITVINLTGVVTDKRMA